MTSLPLRLSPEAARTIRQEVARAGGREVSFLAEVTRDRVISSPRAVARGNRSAVLAVARDAPDGGVMIHNHPSGVLEPSDADLQVAARIHEDGLGTAIVTNEADRIYVVVEPPEPRRIVRLEAGELAALLAPGGALASLPGYEDRREQREMLRFVTTHFNDGGTGLVEAGTGTGKSLAYLVPAARWALANGERTIVSTNTINLQEQLVGKDLGIVGEVIGEKIRWALVKGRGNYISIRRARLAAESAPSLFPDDRTEELRALLDWVDQTDDGSRSDLPFVPSPDLWDEVRSETDACLRAKCPHFQQCHYQRARRSAAERGPHRRQPRALLLGPGCAHRHRQLPRLGGAPLVPARDLRRGAPAGGRGHRAARRRGHPHGNVPRAGAPGPAGARGVLASIRTALAAASSIPARHLTTRIGERTCPRVDTARAAFTEFFRAIEPWIEARGGQGELPAGRARTARCGGGGPNPRPRPRSAKRSTGPSSRWATSTANSARCSTTSTRTKSSRTCWRAAFSTLAGPGRGWRTSTAPLRLCLLPGTDDGNMVRWVEMRRSGIRRIRNICFSAAPVELGPLLAAHLFDRVETAVLTSATLAAAGDFGYLRRRLGLQAAARPALADPSTPAGPSLPPGPSTRPGPSVLADARPDHVRVAERVLDSPFDHAAQSMLAVPDGSPRAARRPGHRGPSRGHLARGPRCGGDHGRRRLRAVHLLRGAARGGGNTCAPAAPSDGGRFWVQGEHDRTTLLRRFARSGEAILLGTTSFW